jgi:uncharacterized membrane-anchored protein
MKFVMDRQEQQMKSLMAAQTATFKSIIAQQDKSFQKALNQMTNKLPTMVSNIVEGLLPSICSVSLYVNGLFTVRKHY